MPTMKCSLFPTIVEDIKFELSLVTNINKSPFSTPWRFHFWPMDSTLQWYLWKSYAVANQFGCTVCIMLHCECKWLNSTFLFSCYHECCKSVESNFSGFLAILSIMANFFHQNFLRLKCLTVTKWCFCNTWLVKILHDIRNITQIPRLLTTLSKNNHRLYSDSL